MMTSFFLEPIECEFFSMMQKILENCPALPAWYRSSKKELAWSMSCAKRDFTMLGSPKFTRDPSTNVHKCWRFFGVWNFFFCGKLFQQKDGDSWIFLVKANYSELQELKVLVQDDFQIFDQKIFDFFLGSWGCSSLEIKSLSILWSFRWRRCERAKEKQGPRLWRIQPSSDFFAEWSREYVFSATKLGSLHNLQKMLLPERWTAGRCRDEVSFSDPKWGFAIWGSQKSARNHKGFVRLPVLRKKHLLEVNMLNPSWQTAGPIARLRMRSSGWESIRGVRPLNPFLTAKKLFQVFKDLWGLLFFLTKMNFMFFF